MQLYLDMDGVLADFDKRARQILGTDPSDFQDKHGSKYFWTMLHSTPDFFSSFEPMLDSPFLIDAVRHLEPMVITGVPNIKGELVAAQKLAWIAQWHPWMNGRVITCPSQYKSLWCRPGDIIVDDRTEYRHLWEAKGGIWVHHTSAYESIRQLRDLGVIE